MKPITDSNPHGAGRTSAEGERYIAQITGLREEAIAHIRSRNASQYIKELIYADIAKGASEPQPKPKQSKSYRYIAQITGISSEAIAHLKTVNASKYLKQLIHADLGCENND